MKKPLLVTVALLLFGLAPGPGGARAAESYDNCSGFITSLPAVVSSQGVWCLRKDLSTGIGSGNAITIATNNVTIDCNGFRVGGLAAGPASTARGIQAQGRSNLSVRHCNIRGFRVAIEFDGGAGHLVEHNRLDSNLYAGIDITESARNVTVRNNSIYDTGGAPGLVRVIAISGYNGTVEGNTVSGVYSNTPSTLSLGPMGIFWRGHGSVIRDNHVSNLDSANGNNLVAGIITTGGSIVIEDNVVLAGAPGVGYGLLGN